MHRKLKAAAPSVLQCLKVEFRESTWASGRRCLADSGEDATVLEIYSCLWGCSWLPYVEQLSRTVNLGQVHN